MFEIEDERHAEPQGDFASFDAALAELRRRATLPWDEPPNRAPCMSWRTCRRTYEIIEYDDSTVPWQLLARVGVLQVSSEGPIWSPGDSDQKA